MLDIKNVGEKEYVRLRTTGLDVRGLTPGAKSLNST